MPSSAFEPYFLFIPGDLWKEGIKNQPPSGRNIFLGGVQGFCSESAALISFRECAPPPPRGSIPEPNIKICVVITAGMLADRKITRETER